MSTPERVGFEADYWQALLDDLDALNRSVRIAAEHVLDSSVVFVSLGLLASDRDRNGTLTTQGLNAAHAAQEELLRCQSALMGILEIAIGRAKALKAELADEAPVPQLGADASGEEYALSAFDEANVGLVLSGHGNWFGADLLRLIARAECGNRELLRRGFPRAVAAYLAYLRQDDQ